VSKNGNLLLSIPVRGDGTIDAEEEKIVAAITGWMTRHGDAVHGSRPWRVFGEGPTQVGGGMFGEGKVTFAAGDVRYWVKDGALYAAFLAVPDGAVTLGAIPREAVVERVRLVGGPEVPFALGAGGLELRLPGGGLPEFVPMVRIDGRGLV
jgi:alpha-L-fucosidase